LKKLSSRGRTLLNNPGIFPFPLTTKGEALTILKLSLRGNSVKWLQSGGFDRVKAKAILAPEMQQAPQFQGARWLIRLSERGQFD
jgi:hypothetical protein